MVLMVVMMDLVEADGILDRSAGDGFGRPLVAAQLQEAMQI